MIIRVANVRCDERCGGPSPSLLMVLKQDGRGQRHLGGCPCVAAVAFHRQAMLALPRALPTTWTVLIVESVAQSSHVQEAQGRLSARNRGGQVVGLIESPKAAEAVHCCFNCGRTDTRLVCRISRDDAVIKICFYAASSAI